MWVLPLASAAGLMGVWLALHPTDGACVLFSLGLFSLGTVTMRWYLEPR
jgi:hypothetical protein